MEQKRTRPKKASKGEWIFSIVVGVVFLTWFFSTRDYRTSEEKINDDIENQLREERINARVSESRQSRYTDLLADTKRDLKAYGVDYTNVEIAESGCLWVYVIDNGKNRDGLATTLCSRAKRNFISCVTIVDSKGNTLGRSMCKWVCSACSTCLVQVVCTAVRLTMYSSFKKWLILSMLTQWKSRHLLYGLTPHWSNTVTKYSSLRNWQRLMKCWKRQSYRVGNESLIKFQLLDGRLPTRRRVEILLRFHLASAPTGNRTYRLLIKLTNFPQRTLSAFGWAGQADIPPVQNKPMVGFWDVLFGNVCHQWFFNRQWSCGR